MNIGIVKKSKARGSLSPTAVIRADGTRIEFQRVGTNPIWKHVQAWRRDRQIRAYAEMVNQEQSK